MSRFGRLWASTAASNLGDGILLAGLPVLASTTTTSPLQIGAVQASVFAPMLLASLPSGVAADRYDRTRLMTGANVVRSGGLALLVAMVVLTGDAVLTAVYLAGILLGLFETLSDTAAQTALPMLVRPQELTRSNSRLVGTQQVLNSGIGAPLGAVLAAVGAGWLFGSSAALYGIAGGLAALLGPLLASSDAGKKGQDASVRREVREGFDFLRAHPALRRMGIANGMTNLGNAAFFGVGILFFIGPYGLPRAGYGVALGLLAVGATAGTAVGDRITRMIGHRRVLLLGAAASGLAYAVLGLADSPVVAGLALFGLGLTGMVWNVSNRVARQVLTPEGLLGRVSSVMRVAALAASPLGALLGGAVAGAFGLRAVVAVTTAVALSTLWLFLRIPQEALDLDDIPSRSDMPGTEDT